MNQYKRKYENIETIAIHAGKEIDPTTSAVMPPMHLSTTFERHAIDHLRTPRRWHIPQRLHLHPRREPHAPSPRKRTLRARRRTVRVNILFRHGRDHERLSSIKNG